MPDNNPDYDARQEPVKSKLRSELSTYIDSRHPVILAVVDEEDRFLRVEESVLTQTRRIDRVYSIDFNGKLTDRKTGHTTSFSNPRDAIEWFAKPYTGPKDGEPEPAPGKVDLKAIGPVKHSVMIYFDVMYHMQDSQGVGYSNPGLTRVIKSIQTDLVTNKRSLVLVSHMDFVPPELQHHVAVVRYPLPDREYLRSLVRIGAKWFAPKGQENDPKAWLQIDEETEIAIATLLLGFRGWEAENVLARACNKNLAMRLQHPEAGIKPEFDVETIRIAKIETIGTNPALTVVIPRTFDGSGMEQIGGAGNLKNWFTVRERLFSEEARNDGILMPKGAVIMGHAGCGKDWAVEHIAEKVGWTTIYADLGAAKGKWQGESHRNFREIISTAEAQAPCFLVISEWEKMMASAFSGGGPGNDTNEEIFATFLNWMQRRKAQVFVWALTNDLEGVPLSALRAGRWDKIWFMDLPAEWEREDIFKIHLNGTGWNPEKYGLDVATLAQKTDGYTGSEIRHIVNEAIVLKFINDGPKSQNKPLMMDHIQEAIQMIPSSMKMRKTEILNLRDYAKEGSIESANSPSRNVAINPSGRRQKIGGKVAAEIL